MSPIASIRLGLVKRANPIETPGVCDFSSIATPELARPLDFSRLSLIASPAAVEIEGYRIEARDALRLSFDLIESPDTTLIPPLEVPPKLSANLIVNAEAIGIRLLLGEAVSTCQPLGDGHSLPNASIVNGALDEGLTLLSGEICGYLLDTGLFLEEPEVMDVLYAVQPFANLLEPPEIVSPLRPLSHTQVLGKAYRVSGPTQTTLSDWVTTCPHGLVRSQCGTCLENRDRLTPRRTQTEVQVVDVFEQLRYILQPPILPFELQPIVFPNGNRPYNYQIAGVKWLTEHNDALLADQMGLGKTVQAIVAMRVLFRSGDLQRALVVCPASMINVWEREVLSWAPELRPLKLPSHRTVREDAWRSHTEIYIVSYETLRNDAEWVVNELGPGRFDLFVLDEAQKIKNPSSKVHRVVKLFAPKYRWALTGTPLENSEDDTVALFQILKPGLFASSANTSYTLGSVKRMIAPFWLRRTIEEVKLDLPSLTHQDHWLDLRSKQRQKYDEMEAAGKTDLRNNLRRNGTRATRIHVFALINRLKQICNYDVESGQSSKLEFLKDELEGLVADNDKALVFSQYPVKTLKSLESELTQFRPLTYDGTLSSRQRDAVVRAFEENELNWAMLMSIRAGGLGLTLTRANHVFHFDHWWNPAVEDQASARVYRIGQRKPVFIHSMYTVDTIEERIHNLLQQKRALFREVFGKNLAADDDDLKALSDEDLFGLFGLDVPDAPAPNTESVETFTASAARHPSPKVFSETALDMSAREFEEAIRRIFAKLGCTLSLTKQTGDGGIDLDGYHNATSGRVVVQCKRYRGTVGVSAVRELYGVAVSEQDITQGFLVTTGRFSRDAIDFAQGKRLRLIDGVELDAMASVSGLHFGH